MFTCGPAFWSGGAASVGHRYWRLYVTATNGDSHVGISTLDMMEALLGEDVTSGGTATASSSYPGLNPDAAFDGSASTDWASADATAVPQWVQYDFGAGVYKSIVQVWITIRTGSWGPGQAPKDFDVQWSDDGSSWTTQFSITNSTGWTSGLRRYFDAAGEHVAPPVYEEAFDNGEFWRLIATAVDGGGVLALQEFRMYDTNPGGSNIVTGGTPYVSSTIEGSATSAFDNLTNGAYWAATNVAAWIGYKFPTAKAVTAVQITSRPTFYNQAPKDFIIQKWNGTAYVDVMTLTGITGWTASQTRWFDSTGEITGW